MARITVEDCLTKETNRFALVLLAAKRTKQILRGAPLLLEDKRDNKSVVNSLREIAEGKVRFKTEEDLEKERQEALREREARLAEAKEAEEGSGEETPPNGDGEGGEEGSGEEGGVRGRAQPSATGARGAGALPAVSDPRADRAKLEAAEAAAPQ